MSQNTSQTTHSISDQFDIELDKFQDEIYTIKGTGKLLMDFELTGTYSENSFNIGQPVYKKEVPIKRNKSNSQRVINKSSKNSKSNLF